MVAKGTRATKLLEQAGIAFAAVAYDYDATSRSRGAQAAEAMGVQPDRVLKTLLALVDGRPVCAIVPSDQEVSMKRLAASFGGKSAQMMPPADAERITGYRIGGISPFGQSRQLPTVLDARALGHPLVFVNGGQRGLQLQLDPACIVHVLSAGTAMLGADLGFPT
jgi:Cys-tRNA(Pro)/Cys-tRNA(Cys) deacylase